MNIPQVFGRERGREREMTKRRRVREGEGEAARREGVRDGGGERWAG